MATPYSKPSIHSFLLASFFLLLTTINLISAQRVSFNYPRFTKGETLIVQGNALIHPDGYLSLPADPSIEITTSRVLYGKPVTIWDSKTGNVASFVTSFSFRVTNFDAYGPADGLIFFLAPWKTDIPPNSTGGNLGVVNDNTAKNRFVGVEFDTFKNDWDPTPTHVGINVNSIISLNTANWKRVSQSLEQVTITYDGQAKILTVVVTHENGEFTIFSQYIDLKVVLPQEVSVGFSATTTKGGREYHGLHTWSFNSNLNTNNPTTTEDPNNIININASSA